MRRFSARASEDARRLSARAPEVALRLVLFFLIGLGLFGAKRTLHAQLVSKPALRVRAAGESPRDRQGSIDRALLAESALEAGAPLQDPVLRERLLNLLAASPHGPAPSDKALLALARELDLFQRDTLLQTRLASNAELHIRAGLQVAEPSEQELRAYLSQHRERYLRSERFSFVQVFLSRALHPDLEGAARALRERLISAGVTPSTSAQQGDPSNLPHRVQGSARRSVESRFGATIAAALPTLPVGSWSAPLASPRGVHLIWLIAHEPESPATLAEVRQQLRADFLEQAREQAFARRLQELRAQRRVELIP